MLPIIGTVLALAYLASLLLIAHAAARAPMGYESKAGFVRGREPTP